MKKKIFMSAAALGLIVCTSGAAAQCMQVGPGADMITPGCLYGGPGGDVKYQRLPNYETNIFVDSTTEPIYKYDTIAVITGGGEGMIGYVFPTNPAWLGENFRIEFAGGYRAGSRTHNANNNLAAPPSTYVQLDGSFFVGYGIVNQQVGRLEIDYKQWQIRLTAKSDFPIAPAFILTPSITIFGGRSDAEYLERSRVGVPGNVADGILDEDIETDQYGIRFGAAVAYEATQVLRLFVGGYVGFAYMSSDYSGENCTANSTAPLTDCANTALIAPALNRNVTDSDTEVAFIGGVYAGARYSLGWVIFTVAGEVDYNSAVPGIRHATLANPTPASLTSSGEFAFSGKFEARFPF